MISDEKVFAEKEVQLARAEYAILPTVIHRMNHHEKIRRKLVVILGRILFHLGRRTDTHAIFNGERMKMKQRLQHELLFHVGRIFEINPEKQICVAQQRRHQKHLDVACVKAALRSECE